jgi:phenylalanine-4-hydroxylase
VAVGSRVISAFAGPVDPDSFGLEYPVPSEKTHRIEHAQKDIDLYEIYQRVRDIREKNCSFAVLPAIWEKLKKDHPEDWLCSLEILELLKDKNIEDDFYREVKAFLESKRAEGKSMEKLIDDGFAMVE